MNEEGRGKTLPKASINKQWQVRHRRKRDSELRKSFACTIHYTGSSQLGSKKIQVNVFAM